MLEILLETNKILSSFTDCNSKHLLLEELKLIKHKIDSKVSNNNEVTTEMVLSETTKTPIVNESSIDPTITETTFNTFAKETTSNLLSIVNNKNCSNNLIYDIDIRMNAECEFDEELSETNNTNKININPNETTATTNDIDLLIKEIFFNFKNSTDSSIPKLYIENTTKIDRNEIIDISRINNCTKQLEYNIDGRYSDLCNFDDGGDSISDETGTNSTDLSNLTEVKLNGTNNEGGEDQNKLIYDIDVRFGDENYTSLNGKN